MSKTRQLKIFISYAREDNNIANRIYNELAAHPNLLPWLDEKKLLAGADWKEEIFDAIEESDFILILLSSNSIDKQGFVQREIREAIDKIFLLPPGKIGVIPVRLENCEPRYRELKKLNYLDLFSDWNRGISKLFVSLGIKQYTHNFVATGGNKKGGCYLAPLSQYIEKSESNDIVPVSVSMIPIFDWKKVPAERLKRVGIGDNVFLKLWHNASCCPELYYRKSDWIKLEHLLFEFDRADEDKKALVDIIIRQWALSEEMGKCDADAWNTLRSFVQKVELI